jgi:hypothetical protein
MRDPYRHPETPFRAELVLEADEDNDLWFLRDYFGTRVYKEAGRVGKWLFLLPLRSINKMK